MRQFLTGFARGGTAQTRGGLLDQDAISLDRTDEWLAIHEAQDRRKAKVIELRYFGRLNGDELAEAGLGDGRGMFTVGIEFTKGGGGVNKASVDEIRARFDADVERFSNLETGQMSTQDAALVMELIAASARRVTPEARALLDLGCGAGNFSLKLAQVFAFNKVTLVDLSANMLDRAMERLAATGAELRAMQCDVRDLDLEPESQDVIVAAAVLHHLRAEVEWAAVFRQLFAALRPGGSLWIWDLIAHDIPGVQAEMWARYGAYLTSLKGEAYRDHVFEYVAYEDSPRSVAFQLHHLRAAGFQADVIHKNGSFAAIGAWKP